MRDGLFLLQADGVRLLQEALRHDVRLVLDGAEQDGAAAQG